MCYRLILLEIALGQASRFFGTRRNFGGPLTVIASRYTRRRREPLAKKAKGIAGDFTNGAFRQS